MGGDEMSNGRMMGSSGWPLRVIDSHIAIAIAIATHLQYTNKILGA